MLSSAALEQADKLYNDLAAYNVSWDFGTETKREGFDWHTIYMAVIGSHILYSVLPMSLASNRIPTIMVAAYGIIGMSIMPLVNMR